MRSIAVPMLLLAALVALAADARAGEGAGEGPVLTRAPELIHEVLPTYPDAAIAAGVEGDVQVELTIEADGSAGEPTVIAGLGHGCDEAALEAASQLRFTPAEAYVSICGWVTSSGLHSTVNSAPAAMVSGSNTLISNSAGTRLGVPPPTKIDVISGRSAATRSA